MKNEIGRLTSILHNDLQGRVDGDAAQKLFPLLSRILTISQENAEIMERLKIVVQTARTLEKDNLDRLLRTGLTDGSRLVMSSKILISQYDMVLDEYEKRAK